MSQFATVVLNDFKADDRDCLTNETQPIVLCGLEVCLMSEISDSTQSTQSTGTSSCPREFLVSVELYVPTVASFGLRKVSLMHMSYLVYLTARSQWSLAVKLTLARRRKPLGRSKVRILLFCHITIYAFSEKSSWISVSRSPTSAGQWRPATCKLMDEDESCSLNIYVDVGLRRQKSYHLLNASTGDYSVPNHIHTYAQPVRHPVC